MISELYTKRLHLRKMNESDASNLFNIWSNPYVTRYMNINNFTKIEQARDMINFLNKLAFEKKAIRFAIIELKTYEIIGSCGYNMLDFEHPKVEIGYELSKAVWGEGTRLKLLTVY